MIKSIISSTASNNYPLLLLSSESMMLHHNNKDHGIGDSGIGASHSHSGVGSVQVDGGQSSSPPKTPPTAPLSSNHNNQQHLANLYNLHLQPNPASHNHHHNNHHNNNPQSKHYSHNAMSQSTSSDQVMLASMASQPPPPDYLEVVVNSNNNNDNHSHNNRHNHHHYHYHHNNNKSQQAVTFGELVILGYNGSLPQGEKGRRRSKYQLLRRPAPNGIKKSKHYSVKQPQTTKAIQDKEQHSISFTLSRSQAIIVEYQHDDETDMFQIGRSSESPIDFVVIDTMIFDPNKFTGSEKVVQQSTISRFACRILIDRNEPHCARIYAAGFDSSKNIFLGEKATKWQTNGEIDGLTTNGILIMHPKVPFVSKFGGGVVGDSVVSGGGGGGATSDNNNNNNNDCTVYGGVWREVSVCGEIYSVRETRSASQKGVKIENETNVLQDGTLIDLCGATLMWRSADGLQRSPNKRHLEEMIDQLNASRPQCPVGLNTLVIPRKKCASLGAQDDKQPYVYLNCGHVQGYHDWGQTKQSNTRTCPMCFKTGPIVKLTMGIEPSFCTSTGQPTFAFNPCGHMASEPTTRYWSQVLIPHGTNGFHAMCPFCATPLQGDKGYVKLIFQ